MKIFFLYPKAREKQAPSTILYGAAELLKYGWNVDYSDLAFSRWNFLYWFFLPLQKLIIKNTGIGIKIDQALLLLNKIRQSDLLISTSDSAGLPVALLKALKIVKTPQFYTTIGLAGQDKSLGPNWTFTFFKKLVTFPEKIICYSPAEKNFLIERWQIPRDKVIYFPFCVDTDFYQPTKTSRENYVLVVGRDLGRDYQLLLRVARQLPDIPFKLICSPRNLQGLTVPSNVEVEYDVNYQTLRKRYQDCRLVVLPLRETQRASGQICLMEAMACAKTVIVSGVKGLSEVYDLKSNENCIFTPVNNAKVLKGQINRLWNNTRLRRKIGSQACRLVEKKYSQRKYGQWLFKEIKNFL